MRSPRNNPLYPATRSGPARPWWPIRPKPSNRPRGYGLCSAGPFGPAQQGRIAKSLAKAVQSGRSGCKDSGCQVPSPPEQPPSPVPSNQNKDAKAQWTHASTKSPTCSATRSSASIARARAKRLKNQSLTRSKVLGSKKASIFLPWASFA